MVTGHARPAISRKGLKRQLFAELIHAVKQLISMPGDTLALIRKLFGYYTSENRALRMVAKYYTRSAHPTSNQHVPAELLQAYAVVGLAKFLQAKQIGESARLGIQLTDAQKQFAQTFFVSVAVDGLPVGRDHAEHLHHRSSHWGPVYGWSSMPARA